MKNHNKTFFDKYRKNLLKKGQKSDLNNDNLLRSLLGGYPSLTIVSLINKNKT